jgi:HTH-type transcriptional regulator, competence development regulator
MKFERNEKWWLSKARQEGDSFIGAGLLARDPEAAVPAEDLRLAFGRFVRLMRRERGLSVEKLAERAALDLSELVSIEEDLDFRPEPRTVYQLANTFDVPQQRLMQLAGLAVSRDAGFSQEAVRFAARSESTQKLSRDEKAALDAFLTVLSKGEAKDKR